MLKFFAAQINSDQDEGRGPMRTVGTFTRVEPAYALIKGKGVMGIGDGDIYAVRVYDTIDEMKRDQESRKYGSDRVYDGWKKKWAPGYEIHDPRLADPEYQLLLEKQREKEALDAEVARLSQKFQ